MNSLSFRRILINRMPGVKDLVLEQLCPGINVVLGPNAAGKSSLARAICSFWSTDKLKADMHLQALTVLGADELELEIASGKRTCIQFGRETNYPFSNMNSSWAYMFELADLLHSQDREIAEEIIKQVMGGLNIASACSSLKFVENSQRPQGLKSKANSAEKEAEAAVRNQAELEVAAGTIEELEQQLDRINSAAELLAVAMCAVDLHKAIGETVSKEATLKEYDPRAGKLLGNEKQNLDTHIEQMQSEKSKLANAEKRFEQTKQTLDHLTIPADINSEEIRSCISNLRNSEASIEKITARLAAAVSQTEAMSISAETVSQTRRLDPAGLSELLDMAKKCIKLREEYEGLKAVEDWVGPLEATGEKDTVRNGSTILRRWLSAPSAGASLANPNLSGSLLLFAGIFTGLTVFVSSLFALGVVAALVILGVVLFVRRSTDSREIYRDDYTRTGLQQPADWTVESVEKLLESLDRKQAELDIQDAKRQRWADTKQNLSACAEKYHKAYDELKLRMYEYELNVSGDEINIALMLDALTRYRDQSQNIIALHSEMESSSTALDVQIKELGKLLGKDISSSDEAELFLNRHLEESNRYQGETQKLESIQKEIEDTQRRIDQFSQNIDQLYESAGLLPGDYETLRVLSGIYSGWKSANEDYKAAKSVENNQRTRLHEMIGCLKVDIPLLDSLSLPVVANDLENYLSDISIHELENLCNTLKSLVSKQKTTIEEIQSIKNQIDNVKTVNGLEKLTIERNRARDALRKSREEAVEASIGWALAEHLRCNTSQQTHTLLCEAREVFNTITCGEFDILLDENNINLAARRNSDGMNMSLNQLSSGTRAQLLIAARMAYIKSQETEYTLPIVMDESLANSDDERAEQIIAAMCGIAKENRQILYFTAQSDEVGKWEKIASDSELDFNIQLLAR